MSVKTEDRAELAPWPDFLKQPIHHGDRLTHPNGTEFTAVRLHGYADEGDAWRAVYDDATVSRLCLQIGDKGRAVIAAPSASAQCKSCGGNNADTPCAYPEGGQPHCLKGASAQQAEPVVKAEQRSKFQCAARGCYGCKVCAAPAPKLTVWYGSMPESNGKSNWTAILHAGDIAEGYTIDRSEYPDRVRYEADRVRHLIGELTEKPSILDYDAEKCDAPPATRKVVPFFSVYRGYIETHIQPEGAESVDSGAGLAAARLALEASRVLNGAAPAPSASPIDVTKIPGYVSPAQVSETAAAHAKGSKPVDPCDCSACVKMRGGLYGETPSASPALPERIETWPAEQQGLFRKFDVRRVDGSDAPGGKHHGCRYFVLDVSHDPYAKAALTAYAAACEFTHPYLARDLREKWGASPAALTDDVERRMHDFLGQYVCAEDSVTATAALRTLLAASPADQGEDARFFMDHGMWHDRVTGQHLYTQDQYDEMRETLIRAGETSNG